MTKSIRLTDLQLVLLSSAAARENGSLVPLPECIAGDDARVDKAVTSLLRRKLVEEAITSDRSLAWRDKNSQTLSLLITDAGREAIGTKTPAGDDDTKSGDDTDAAKKANPNTETKKQTGDGDAPASRGPGSKIGTVIAMLERPDGTTLEEMVAATGWLPHTTRAALTGLRKKGHVVTSEKVDNVRRYRIAGVAT